jgi:hypothetical protein
MDLEYHAHVKKEKEILSNRVGSCMLPALLYQGKVEQKPSSVEALSNYTHEEKKLYT